MGQFIQRDPIGFAGGDLNLYAYAENDPYNWADPSGLATSGSLVNDAKSAAATIDVVATVRTGIMILANAIAANVVLSIPGDTPDNPSANPPDASPANPANCDPNDPACLKDPN